MIITEYSFILYSDFDIEIVMHVFMFSYANHHSVHTTVTTSYVLYISEQFNFELLMI
jgi:phosphoribosyl-AMP cyclohydrolase